jgi:hypothetical protein
MHVRREVSILHENWEQAFRGMPEGLPKKCAISGKKALRVSNVLKQTALAHVRQAMELQRPCRTGDSIGDLSHLHVAPVKPIGCVIQELYIRVEIHHLLRHIRYQKYEGRLRTSDSGQ